MPNAPAMKVARTPSRNGVMIWVLPCATAIRLAQGRARGRVIVVAGRWKLVPIEA
jgi:hypothetical protein